MSRYSRLILLSDRVFLFALVVAVVALLAGHFFRDEASYMFNRLNTNRLQSEVLDKERTAERLVQDLLDQTPDRLQDEYGRFIVEGQKEQVLLFLYKGTSLQFWSSNLIFPEYPLFDSTFHFFRGPNGYYLQMQRSHGEWSAVAMAPVQFRYPVQNSYLFNYNSLTSRFSQPFQINMGHGEGFAPIYNAEKKFLFSIQLEGSAPGLRWAGLVFALAGFVMFFTTGWLLLKRPMPAGGFLWRYLAASVLYVLVWKFWRAPQALFSQPLFAPEIYATSNVLSSLGDLLLLAVFLAWHMWVLFGVTRHKTLVGQLGTAACIAFALLFFAIAAGIQMLLGSLIIDSHLSLEINNLFSLNKYSLLAYASVLVLVALAGLVLYRLGCLLHGIEDADRKTLLMLVAFTASIVLLGLNLHLWPAVFFADACLVLLLFIPCPFEAKQWDRPILYVFATALFLTSATGIYQDWKKNEDQRIYSQKLYNKQDARAEFLFRDMKQRIARDAYVRAYLSNPVLAHRFVEQRIQQHYLSGYFTRYDAHISAYTAEGIPLRRENVRPLSFYLDLVNQLGVPSSGQGGLYLINSYSALPVYVALVPVYDRNDLKGTLVIQLQQRAFQQESLYPDLLLAEAMPQAPYDDGYSYAVYQRGRLVDKRGDFPYNNRLGHLAAATDTTYQAAVSNGYRHFAFSPHPDFHILVSRPVNGPLYYLATFSFIFFFSVMFYLGVYLLTKVLQMLSGWFWRRRQPDVFEWLQVLSFRAKVLLSIVCGMSLALLLVGIVTVKYIAIQYNADELQKLRVKSLMVANRIERELMRESESYGVSREELTAYVADLRDFFDTDINVFDVFGRLIASTQPDIYEQRIIESVMNPMAYYRFGIEGEGSVVQEERISGLRYTSSYLPLRDEDGRLTGYVNLPYFLKEKDLNARISAFLVTLINLYALLSLLLLTIGIFISNMLTAPLGTIRDQLRRTAATGNPEPLSWNNERDEIGKLVVEYNTTLKALHESAARLAQSEREGAWKEMARQVAHEIKNPLTPMKLNLQRLQMEWERQGPELDRMFERVTRLLINQIDNLSQIATEFSAFATMPEGEPKRVVAGEVLEEVAELHRPASKATIEVLNRAPDAEVLIDRNHLVRVVDNLARNAIQSIPADRQGQIELYLAEQGGHVIISVRDNGSGISPEVQPNLFKPNFSTKSSGMGLGLAIARGIVAKAGGSISFSTIEGEGTEFVVRLPRA